jgi:hypothetical protein
MRVGTHHPPTYENGFFTPELSKNRANHPPEVVLKNNSKSQKNHKMENPTVFDSKGVHLHNEHIIWYI